MVVGRSWTYQTEAESDRSLNFKGSSSGEEKDTELSCFHFFGFMWGSEKLSGAVCRIFQLSLFPSAAHHES